ncbi:MAG: hypothetical protein GX211_10170 [Clostridiaceae bacterium]|jgi:hypothetical protein|nr:hypothetical protein [Clostridiaceae bacterium]
MGYLFRRTVIVKNHCAIKMTDEGREHAISNLSLYIRVVSDKIGFVEIWVIVMRRS